MQNDGTLSRQLTEHVTQAVQRDLSFNTRYADRDDFLKTFFPDQEIFQRVLDKFKARKRSPYLKKSSRWRKFPIHPDGPETAYYKPFQDACNSIYAMVCQLAKCKQNRVWLDRHSKKPSSFTNAAENRPDIVQLLGLMKIWDQYLWELGKEHETRTRMRTRSQAKKEEENIPQLTEDELKKLIAYWCRVVVAVEIKPKKFGDYSQVEVQATILQLAGYMRQVLREQHDRQFVFGLILFHDRLSVWYCDRSGLLGMKDPIDIHSEPLLFIRIIASLSTMSPQDLGWDPTMKLYRQDGKHLFTHELDSKDILAEFKDSAYYYRTRWVIKIEKAEYVTFRALSLSRAEIMCGRAQLVWLAVDTAHKQVVVIKQCWSPFTTKGEGAQSLRSEAEIYRQSQDGNSDNHISRLIHDEAVPKTRTVSDFRKNIRADPLPISEHDDGATGNEPNDQVLHEKTTTRKNHLFQNALPLTERQLCRMVFKDFGYALKRFASLRKLLETVDNCLQGYTFLLTKGILHRDLSLSNILICPSNFAADPFEPEKVVGRLNDLDHAKVDHDYRKGERDRIATPDNMDALKIDLQTIFTTRLKHEYRRLIELHPDTSETIIRLTYNACASTYDIQLPDLYLSTIIQSLKQDKWTQIQENILQRQQRQVLLEDLRIFSCETARPPEFKTRSCENEERSFTLPFVSHRLLAADESEIHTAIHDMESLFWVVMYIVLSRKGPGGSLRDELCQGQLKKESTLHIRNLIYFFFDGPSHILYDNKRKLFEEPGDFAEYILPHIHPYFAPLKPMLEEWWRILHLAFDQSMGSEYIYPHLGFRRAVGECLESLGDNDGNSEEQYKEMMEKEIERRREEQTEAMEMLSLICGCQELPPSTEIREAELDLSPPRPKPVSCSTSYKKSKPHLNSPSATCDRDDVKRRRVEEEEQMEC